MQNTRLIDPASRRLTIKTLARKKFRLRLTRIDVEVVSFEWVAWVLTQAVRAGVMTNLELNRSLRQLIEGDAP